MSLSIFPRNGFTARRAPRALAARSKQRRRQSSLETLETRQLLSYTVSGYTFSLSGSTATASGTLSSDTLDIEAVGGLLEHSVNGGAFSEFWDTATTGTLAADSASTVNIDQAGGAVDLISSSASGASLNSTVFTLSPGGGTSSLEVDDSADTTGGQTYTVNDDSSTDSITGPGIVVNNVDTQPGGITLKGGSGGDTFDVLTTISPDPLTIVAGGADSVDVGDSGDMTGINGNVSISDPTSSYGLTLDDSNDSSGSGDTVTMSATQTTGLGTDATITYANVNAFEVDGGPNGNTFTVTSTIPGKTTDLNAGTGTNTVDVLGTSSGSTLNVLGQGGNDQVDIGGDPSVGAQNVLGAVTVANTATGATDLTVDDSENTSVPTTATLTGNSDGTSTLTGLAPGSITATTADLNSYTINAGTTGGNSLTVDFTNGNPIPFNTSLSYEGGTGGGNTLNLVNGSFVDETVNPTDASDGSIELFDGFNDFFVNYAQTQTVNDTVTVTNDYTFNAPSGQQNISVTDGSYLGNPAILVTSSQAVPSFSPVTIYDKANVTINSGTDGNFEDQSDVLDVIGTPTGLVTLTLNTNNGNDDVSVQSTPDVPTFVNTDGNDNVYVFGPGVAAAGLTVDGGAGGDDTLTFDAADVSFTTANGFLPGELLLTSSGAGTVDAQNFENINIINAPANAPTVTGMPINTVEGAPLVNVIVATFTDAGYYPDATASDFNATINWGDGSSSAGVIVQDASDPSVFYVEGSHTYTTPGAPASTPTVSVVADSLTAPQLLTINGTPVNYSVTYVASAPVPASFSATVDEGPIGVFVLPLTATEGTTLPAGQPLATFIDAGGADPVSNYSASYAIVNALGVTVASGSLTGNITEDGTSDSYTISSPALTLPEEGTYTLQVTVTDLETATSFVGAAPIVVADAALSAGAKVNLTPNTGQTLSDIVVGNFNDADTTTSSTSDFTATIDWGDGSPNSVGAIGGAAGAYTVSGTHQYASPGTYTTTIIVKDVGGSTVTLTGTATVTDLAVTPYPVGTTGTKNFTTVEGQTTGQFVLATFEDPNPLATVSDVQAQLAVGGWGDGTPSAAGVTLAVQQIGADPATGDPIFEVLGSHTYAEETLAGAPDPLSVIITTIGGATTTLTSPPGGGVTVLDASLTGSAGTEITGVEGNATGTVLLGTFVDANQLATVADYTAGGGSVVVNWGDGSAPQTLAAGNLVAIGTADGVTWTINATHTYVEEGTYAYTVTVTDDGGSSTIVSGSAIIADAKLTATATQPTVNTTESPVFPIPEFGKPIFNGAVATFTDANPQPPTGSSSVSDFTATIDWGDGTPQSAGTITYSAATGEYTVTGAHTYADAGVNGGVGTYPITVYVVDAGGSKVTIHNTANVADIPIVLTGQLNPGSDSGEFNNDDVTNINQPIFWGSSEAYSNVVLYANGTEIGKSEAGSDGAWSITSGVALADGTYTITATAIDQFGETTAGPVVITPKLVIDTTGPRITATTFNRLNGEVDFTINDALSGVNNNTLLDSANYQLAKVKGSVPGRFVVTDITITPGGTPGSENVAVQFNSGKVIRGGFYLFTIRGSSHGDASVQDIAGNLLDGEFYGTFPSGNGIPGGDYVAEIDAYHDKIFAPQTVVGTVSPPAPKGYGVGGAPVGAVHSGIHTPAIPRGAGSAVAVAKAHAAAKVHAKAVPQGPRKHK